ncbi:nitrite extrusion protein 2 [Shigella sonnei]|nr:nitrite extrusion protein 2 [Shigella sonnei]
MTSLKTSIKTITYLSDTGCLEIQGASLMFIGYIIFKICIGLAEGEWGILFKTILLYFNFIMSNCFCSAQ